MKFNIPKSKPSKKLCEVEGCLNNAHAWINTKHVCKLHYYKMKNRNPGTISAWWNEYLKDAQQVKEIEK